jgi:hypothetical protein
MKKFLYFFLSGIICLTACNEDGGDGSYDDIAVRTVIESEESSTADIRVYVEGSDGNALTGSVVLLRDSQNRVKNLEFDPYKYCYTGSAAIPGDGLFFVKVRSLAMEYAREFTVPHVILSEKPVVSTFQDADGSSVLSGQGLSSVKEIMVAWNSAGSGSIVYQVSVKTALHTLYSVSTSANNISIPASTLPAGNNYMFVIVAQKIFGDPFFEISDYYSVSVIRGAMVSFNVL